MLVAASPPGCQAALRSTLDQPVPSRTATRPASAKLVSVEEAVVGGRHGVRKQSRRIEVWALDHAIERKGILLTIEGVPEKLELVFEPYVQLNAPRSSGSGWGLGLAISRELARAMGGDLTASSAPEEGTAFTLTLPRSIRIASDESRD